MPLWFASCIAPDMGVIGPCYDRVHGRGFRGLMGQPPVSWAIFLVVSRVSGLDGRGENREFRYIYADTGSLPTVRTTIFACFAR